jgi:phosphatidylethanolamine-binding protein (PEBP) family uncharacterized protein
MHAYVELVISWVFKNATGRDTKTFNTTPAFENCKEPTIPIASPDRGDSGSILAKEYVADAGDRFPTLEWSPEGDVVALVKQWLLVVEDPDAPLPTPIVHGSVSFILVKHAQLP